MKRLDVGIQNYAKPRVHRSGFGLMITLIEVLLIAFAVWGVLIAIQMIFNPTNASSTGRNEPFGEPILCLSVISNGRELWVRRGISEIVTIDLETESSHRTFRRIDRPVPRSCVSQDGMTCLLSIDDREIAVFRGQELLVSDPLPPESATSIALSSNGRIAIRISDGTAVRRWDLSSGEPTEYDFPLSESADWSALDSVGDKLFVSTAQGTLCVFDAKTGVLARKLWGAGPLNAAPVLSEDATCLAVARGRSVAMYDVRSGEIAWTVQTPEPDGFRSLAISPDGRWVAANGISTGIHVLNRSNGQIYRKLFNPNIRRGLAFPPSNDILYSGCNNGSIDVWSLSEGRVVKTITATEKTLTGHD